MDDDVVPSLPWRALDVLPFVMIRERNSSSSVGSISNAASPIAAVDVGDVLWKLLLLDIAATRK
jgi:hypothetical protein